MVAARFVHVLTASSKIASNSPALDGTQARWMVGKRLVVRDVPTPSLDVLEGEAMGFEYLVDQHRGGGIEGARTEMRKGTLSLRI